MGLSRAQIFNRRKVFMKYGLIVNLRTQNIGDDIQCYAMERFLPHLDYLIDREHLDSFYTPTGERVAALLGGWYLHKPLNWPPSPFLKLLPISFHMTTVEAKKYLALMDYGAKWLKRFDTIGCRDKGTMRELKRLKIKSYTSGCFTLTIDPFPDVEPHGKIALVDLSDELVRFIKRRTTKETVLVSHDIKVPMMPEEAVEFARPHKKDGRTPLSHYPIIRDRAYHGSCYPGSWRYRSALVEGLLRFYQGASLVVTSRLHVALPCLALGTPVLTVKDEADLANYRFSTFTPYLNHTTPEDLLTRGYFYDFDNPKPNSAGYKKFVDLIKPACVDFINSCENAPEEPPIDVELWFDGLQKNLRIKNMMQFLMPEAEIPDPKLKNPVLYRF